jgi:cytoskeletal protein RodZ
MNPDFSTVVNLLSWIILGIVAAIWMFQWIKYSRIQKEKSFKIKELAKSVLYEVQEKRQHSWGSSLSSDKNGSAHKIPAK